LNRRPLPRELLENPEGVLYRKDLLGLGYERRAVDAILRAVPVHFVPGYSRPHVLVRDFLKWRDEAWTDQDARPRTGR
jgi:hypothetical protein